MAKTGDNTVDMVLYGCCNGAVTTELANEKCDGDTTQVSLDDTFADTYGFDDNSMVSFTGRVNTLLNKILKAHGRDPVTLPMGAGQTEKSSDTVRDFITAIYGEAIGQNT